jgi:large subunit ribosomal protein L25
VHNLEQLHVESLPGDLPERIDVDISVLVKIGDGVRVKDVMVSDKVRLLDDPETMVAVATMPKVEEEAPVAGAEGVVAPAAVTSTEPELSVERGKKEDEGTEEK